MARDASLSICPQIASDQMSHNSNSALMMSPSRKSEALLLARDADAKRRMVQGEAEEGRDWYGFNDLGQEVRDGSRSLHC